MVGDWIAICFAVIAYLLMGGLVMIMMDFSFRTIDFNNIAKLLFALFWPLIILVGTIGIILIGTEQAIRDARIKRQWKYLRQQLQNNKQKLN